jgi:uncharacterized protein (TIGR02596 family)
MKRLASRKSQAFSLVEMLAVIAIIGVLAALIVPAVKGLMTASQLAQGTDFVMGQLKYAKQVALSENKVIEVRFYKYSDMPGTAANMRALQLWRNNPDGTRTPLDRMYRLPGHVIVSSIPEFTTVGADLSPTPSETLTQLPSGYQFKAFQFRPDGSTTLAAGSNFLTLVNENDVVKKPTQIPSNFSTIQIEVLTGAVSLFRP